MPVRIFGTDSAGKIFSENVSTVDVSQNGARLIGVRAKLKIDEIIGVTYGKNTAHFRVKWLTDSSSSTRAQVGLLNLAPEKRFWDFTVPSGSADNFRPSAERRKSPRIKCSISAELRAQGQPVIWGKVSDLSLGGCFVEMPIPLKQGASFEIGLWLGETKLRVQGQVATTAPGFGIGVRFGDLSAENHEFLRRHIETIAEATSATPFPLS
jgi:hypothetical protein